MPQFVAGKQCTRPIRGMTWHRAAAATKTRIKQGANSPPCPTGHGGRHSLCGRRGLQRRVHCLSGFIIGRSSAAHLQHVPQQGKKTLLTDCTRLAVSEIFPLLFVPCPRPLSLIEPQSQRWLLAAAQRYTLEFSSKEIAVFCHCHCCCCCCVVFLVRLHVKVAARGWGHCVCVCVRVCIQLLSIAQCGGCYRRGGAGRQGEGLELKGYPTQSNIFTKVV